MQDIHDERRVPLEVQPESRSLLESIRFWLSFGRLRRNKREAAQAKAAAANAQAAAARAAQFDRDFPAAAARMLARLGRGK